MLTNSGAFAIQNDATLSGPGTLVNSGTITKTSASTAGITTIAAPITIRSGSTINVASGNLSTPNLFNVGTISLAPQTSLNVTGTFSQTTAGTLNVAIGGSPASNLFGRLTATSTGSLAGTLNATLANGFTPIVGQTFPVMTFSLRDGNFTTFNPPKNGTISLFEIGLTATGST